MGERKPQKTKQPEISGYLLAMYIMTVVSMVCNIVLGIMQQQPYALSGWDVILCVSVFACIFCEFLYFKEGKRLVAVLFSLVPLFAEIFTEIVFPVICHLQISIIDATVYIGIPAITTLFFVCWKEGDKDTIPLIGVLLVMFVLFITGYSAFYSIRMLIFSTQLNVTTPLFIAVLLGILSRICHLLVYLFGFWNEGHVSLSKKGPYGA